MKEKTNIDAQLDMIGRRLAILEDQAKQHSTPTREQLAAHFLASTDYRLETEQRVAEAFDLADVYLDATRRDADHIDELRFHLDNARKILLDHAELDLAAQLRDVCQKARSI